jgi:hypothetical protein
MADGNGLLDRFNVLSAMILIGGDISADVAGVALGGIFSIVPVIGTAIGYILGYASIIVIGAFLIFLNEWYSSGKLVESILDSIIALFLLTIPTPIAGVGIGLLALNEATQG